jgi:bifunctional non-homologous end joining protein LigD
MNTSNINIIGRDFMKKSETQQLHKGIFFIIGYDQLNDMFHVGMIKHKEIIQVGAFSKGLKPDEKKALIQTLFKNKKTDHNGKITVEPGICVELTFQALVQNQLKNPVFHSFRFDVRWDECTWEKLMFNMAPLHQDVQITHWDKPIWKNPFINKEQYITYLLEIAPFMLPFLQNRLLTVIRYPHGVFGEAFYQKNCPDYAPSFIKTVENEGINYIVCNDLSTFIWLGNQLAIEFHIPFQTIDTNYPTEIVFDLDPPSIDRFPLAIKAAVEMKKIFDSFQLKSFPKLSGKKGVQIHIPLSKHSFRYEETRIFTSFIAEYLVALFPEDFTIERLKKNRGQKLYIDYLQHAEGKTIIAPYSPRGKEGATIAAPLYWDEVNEHLKVENYTIINVRKRVNEVGCPFQEYFSSPQDDVIREILNFIKRHEKGVKA